MRIVRTGGVNKYLANGDADYGKFGYGNNILVQLRDEISNILKQSGKVLIITSAKPNADYYNQIIQESGFDLNELDILGKGTNKVQWNQYEAIIMMGGTTIELYDWLIDTGFSLEAIPNCQLLGGDSAGAYVLGKYVMVDNEPDGKVFEIKPGFVQKGNLLVAGHINNPRYHQQGLKKKLVKFSKENDANILPLQENEMQTEMI